MATTRADSVGPLVLGLNKQNGQLRGQNKPASVQAGPTAPGKVLGAPQKVGGANQDGGIKFGDDWKRSLQLPPKDTRVKTSVSVQQRPQVRMSLSSETNCCLCCRTSRPPRATSSRIIA